MNRKQLSILLVLLVIVGLAGLMVYRKQNQSAGSGNPLVGQKLIPGFPINEVAHILVQNGSNQLNLIKKDDRWRVAERADYPANYSQIGEFLIKLNDLKVVQSEDVGPSQLSRLWLAPDAPTNTPVSVEFRDAAGKTLKTLLLGKKHMRKSARPSPMGDLNDEGWPDGRYLMVGAGSRAVALVSEPFSNIEPKPEQWLSKDFFKIEKPRAIAVDFPESTNSWKLLRESETAQWTLADAKPEEQLDSSKVSGVTSPFSYPSFNDVLVAVSPEQAGLDRPTTIQVDTFEHFSYSIRVGAKTNDAYPITVTVDASLQKERTPGPEEKPEDKEKLDKEFQDKLKKFEEKLTQEKSFANRIFLVSSWSVDSLLKPRAQLMKTEATDSAAPGEDHDDHDHDANAEDSDADADLGLGIE